MYKVENQPIWIFIVMEDFLNSINCVNNKCFNKCSNKCSNSHQTTTIQDINRDKYFIHKSTIQNPVISSINKPTNFDTAIDTVVDNTNFDMHGFVILDIDSSDHVTDKQYDEYIACLHNEIEKLKRRLKLKRSKTFIESYILPSVGLLQMTNINNLKTAIQFCQKFI